MTDEAGVIPPITAQCNDSDAVTASRVPSSSQLQATPFRVDGSNACTALALGKLVWQIRAGSISLSSVSLPRERRTSSVSRQAVPHVIRRAYHITTKSSVTNTTSRPHHRVVSPTHPQPQDTRNNILRFDGTGMLHKVDILVSKQFSPNPSGFLPDFDVPEFDISSLQIVSKEISVAKRPSRMDRLTLVQERFRLVWSLACTQRGHECESGVAMESSTSLCRPKRHDRCSCSDTRCRLHGQLAPDILSHHNALPTVYHIFSESQVGRGNEMSVEEKQIQLAVAQLIYM